MPNLNLPFKLHETTTAENDLRQQVRDFIREQADAGVFVRGGIGGAQRFVPEFSRALGVAAASAAHAVQVGGGWFEVAAAKARIGEAATVAAGIAHQVHGAMGFTREYDLHLSTRRLRAWREEFGDEGWWAETLGRAAAAGGCDAIWAFMISVGHTQ